MTATASWLDARALGGHWRLRIDDLDQPRVVDGAEISILRTLERHGLYWDGPVTRQSDRHEHYADALNTLASWCFSCRCSRRQLRGVATYPGTCRHNRGVRLDGTSPRMLVPATAIGFRDLIQGENAENLSDTIGDFVIWRRDGFASYQLAVVVDDELDGITRIVRGADLIDNTPRQLLIRRRLDEESDTKTAPIEYAHLPVITESSGQKLSKQTKATGIDDRFIDQNIATVLDLLGFDRPPRQTAPEMLAWATRHWRIDEVPATRRIENFHSI